MSPDLAPASLPASPPAPSSSQPEPFAPRTGYVLMFLLAVALFPRLLLMPVNENLYGDAVVRTELAERWAKAPHWISSWQDGAYQFGPLHVYLVGAALSVWPDRADAGRAVSLLFGVLSILPLYFLTRRLFGWKAAVWACLGLAAWGMHLQLSTTAASEAVALFLVLWVLHLFAEGLHEGRLGPILWSALVLNLACATRYDAWLLIPVLAVVLFFGDKDKIAASTRAVLFTLFCLPFPMIWMQGNELVSGNPLAPVAYIDQFHASWVADSIGRYGQVAFRLMNLFFWPGAALLTLSPAVAFFGMLGVYLAFKKAPEHRWLVWVLLVPTAYFIFRAVVLADFVPLARFTVNQVALLLPFLAVGFEAVVARRSERVRSAVLWGAALIAVALPLGMGMATYQQEGKVASALKPVSPTSTNRPEVRALAEFLQSEVLPAGNGAVVLDTDPEYRDVQVAFFSGLPEARLARVRWPDFEAQLAKLEPEWLVQFRGGTLEKRADFDTDRELVQLGQAWFEPAAFRGDGVWLYKKVVAPAPPADTGTADKKGLSPSLELKKVNASAPLDPG